MGRDEGTRHRRHRLDLLTTAWLGTLQQFARFRYFGEFKQPAGALADGLDGVLTRMARP